MELFKMDKSQDKEIIYIDLDIDPKGQGDLQGHAIFDMTSKSLGLPRIHRVMNRQSKL